MLFLRWSNFAIASSFLLSLAVSESPVAFEVGQSLPKPLQLRATENNITDVPTNATSSAIASARAIVADAIKKATLANKARVENPLRNIYTLRPADAAKVRRDSPTLFEVTPEIAAACALIAEVEAAAEAKNGTLHKDYSAIIPDRKRSEKETRATDEYWMGNLQNLGTQPFGNDTSYKVFRNVQDKQYGGGARGDGVTVKLSSLRTMASGTDYDRMILQQSMQLSLLEIAVVLIAMAPQQLELWFIFPEEHT
jgi:hypothetical protein